MKNTDLARFTLLPLLCLLVACGPSEEGESSGQEEEITTLEGTRWQLVQINTTGDFVFTPDDGSKYTLQFRTENRLTGVSDCNRLTGNWNQQDAELSFDPFSSTRSLCLPGSLHNHFMSNLINVNAYETTGGHLLLSTTIPEISLELEPVAAEEL
jgi:heat shock protein HslJ